MPQELQLTSIPNAIDGAGALRKFVVNTFYGWGYNAYRDETKLRADDLLIRNEVCRWLGQVCHTLAEREQAFRRDNLPPPTREHPFPDSQAVATARNMVRDQQRVEAIEVEIRNAAVPENDRTWQRHRTEGGTLAQLQSVDLDLAEAVLVLLRATAENGENPGATTVPADLIGAIRGALDRRKAVLSVLGA